ncbi:hypothetical protein ACFQ60_18695 [Streptomyces zhihengii]
MLLCAAAGATTAGLHAAEARRGPLPELARQRAHVTVDVTVESDPRPTGPKVNGPRVAPGSIALDVRATRVTARGGAVTEVRTPLLVLVTARGTAGPWRLLLPSTKLRLSGTLAPPLGSDDRFAAVLRPYGSGPPRVTGPPTAVQRIAGGLRAGLREATDGLPPDARALLPGLVVGDTSRVTPTSRRPSRRPTSPIFWP